MSGTERKLSNSTELTHEERLERLQRLVADLRAVDVAEEQRRILRDFAHSAEELANGLENTDERLGSVEHFKKRALTRLTESASGSTLKRS